MGGVCQFSIKNVLKHLTNTVFIAEGQRNKTMNSGRQAVERFFDAFRAGFEEVIRTLLWPILWPLNKLWNVIVGLYNRWRGRQQRPEHTKLIDWFACKFFMFDIWGDSLKDRNVKTVHRSLAAALMIILLINMYIWTRAFSNMFGSVLLAIPMALGVSGMLGVLERSIGVADLRYHPVRAWSLMTLRVVVSIGLAMVSAKPLQQGLYERDIMAEIEREELSLRAKLIKRGTEAETKRYGTMIIKTETGRDAAILVLKQSRKDQFEEMLADQAKSREQYEKSVQKDKDWMSSEINAIVMAGGGRVTSGTRGFGPRARNAATQVENAIAEKRNWEAESTKERRAFVNGTAGLIQLQHSKANKEIAKFQSQKSSEITSLQRLKNRQLAEKYGGQWRISKGFLKQDEVLMRMSDEIKSVWWGVFACTLFMILLDLLMLVIKLALGENLANYISVEAQAAAGNPDALQKLKSDGYDQDQIDEMTRSAPVRKAEAVCRKRQLDLIKTFQTFLLEVNQICKQYSYKKWIVKKWSITWKQWAYRTRHEINSVMLEAYQDGVPKAINALRKAESDVERVGGKVPAWPVDEVDDPRNMERPWEFSDAQLRERGWVNPEINRTVHLNDNIQFNSKSQ